MLSKQITWEEFTKNNDRSLKSISWLSALLDLAIFVPFTHLVPEYLIQKNLYYYKSSKLSIHLRYTGFPTTSVQFRTCACCVMLIWCVLWLVIFAKGLILSLVNLWRGSNSKKTSCHFDHRACRNTNLSIHCKYIQHKKIDRFWDLWDIFTR